MTFSIKKQNRWFVFLFLLLLGCDTKKQPNTSAKDSALKDPYELEHYQDSVHHVNSGEADVLKSPKEIDINLFAKRKIRTAEPFQAIDAFAKLYPGDTVHEAWHEASSALITWKCSKCTPKQFAGLFEGDTVAFPCNYGNDTRLLNTHQFDANGTQYKVLSTTTSEFSADHLRTGRFNCGILGLSLFQRKNNQWELISFNPALGCYGMFQTVEHTEIASLKNNFLVYVNNRTGGPGGPYWGDIVITGIYNNEFKELGLVSNTSREGAYEGGGNWKSELKITQTGAGLLPLTIQLITSGEYDYDKFIINDDISNLPESLRKTARPKDHCTFVIIRTYTFKNGSYQLEAETLDRKD